MKINSDLLTATQNSSTAKSTATPACQRFDQRCRLCIRFGTIDSDTRRLRKRLYDGSEKGIPATPLVESKDIGAADPVMWLNADDRSALSDLYGYAPQTAADLHYVDDIAFPLAYYRQTAGTVVSNWTTNPMHDMEGHRVMSSFSDKDVASAKVIQPNDNNTRLANQCF